MKYPAESYTRAECLAMLDACPDTPVGLRNRALIVLMWQSGLRLAEALALRPRDIDHEYLSIRVLHGKGDKARTVATNPRALGIIDAWLAVRDEYLADMRAKPDFSATENAPLICTSRGAQLTQQYVREMLPRIGRKAGVQKRVHAHAFRHTFAVELSRENVPVRDIQQLLGHASLATTSIYLASLSPEEALDRVRGRSF